MTFEDRERSDAQGNKVFLYVWQRGIKVWRYATTAADVTMGGLKYLSARGMSHGGIEEGAEVMRASVDVEVPINNPVAGMYIQVAPADSVSLVISEYHIGDEADVHAIWGGRIVGCKLNPEQSTATITHEPTYTSIKRTGLRRVYQVNDPRGIYAEGTGVLIAEFQRSMTVIGITGNLLEAVGFATEHIGHWPGGILTYEVEQGVIDRRYVKSLTGTVATLDAPPLGMKVGQTFTALPGYDGTLDTRIDFFHDGDNYGGFPFFGLKNPFGADPIY